MTSAEPGMGVRVFAQLGRKGQLMVRLVVAVQRADRPPAVHLGERLLHILRDLAGEIGRALRPLLHPPPPTANSGFDDGDRLGVRAPRRGKVADNESSDREQHLVDVHRFGVYPPFVGPANIRWRASATIGP